MKKFNFRLEPILKLRKQQEDQKKRAVGDLLAEINALQRQALEMADAIRRQDRALRQNVRGTVDINWIAYYQGYVTHLRQSISQKIDEVAQIQKKLVQARHELTEAARQTKILEKLKEKRKQRYEKELRRREIGELDEIAAQQCHPARSSA